MRFFASVPTIYLLRPALLCDTVVEGLGVGVVVLGGVEVLGFGAGGGRVGVGSLYSAVERDSPHTIHSVSESSLYVPQFLQFQPNCPSPLNSENQIIS